MLWNPKVLTTKTESEKINVKVMKIIIKLRIAYDEIKANKW